MSIRQEPVGVDPIKEEILKDVFIRHAMLGDLQRIVEIYNESIPGGWSTADTSPISVAERVDWFKQFDRARRPIWVAEAQGQVVATAYLSSFYQGRRAYDATAELSIYICQAFQRRGLGTLLKKWVIDKCPELGVTTLLSMHFDHNEATRKINEKFGFEQMGHLKEIAVVDGVSRGLIISGLRIPAKAGVKRKAK